MPRVIRQSRFLFLRWVVFLLIVGCVLALCFLTCELDHILYEQILISLQERYIDGNASISSAHYVQGKGFEVTHFELVPKYTSGEKKYHASTRHSRKYPPVIVAERVRMVCKSRLNELVWERKSPISAIIFDSATIHAYRRPDGSWSLEALRSNPDVPPMEPVPVIQFRNTTVELHDWKDSMTERKLILHNVELTINPPEEMRTDVFGNKALNSDGTPRKIISYPFTGSAESEFSRSISFYGDFYPVQGAIRLEVDVNGLQFTEEFRRSLPQELSERFQEMRFFRSEIHTHLAVATHLKDMKAARFRLEGQMIDGRSTDPRFPKLLSTLSTDFQVTNEGFYLPNLVVRHGNGTINLNVTQRGYGEKAQKRIISKCQDIRISEALLESLPEKLHRFLQGLSPNGLLNMEAEFYYDGHFWTPTGKIQCSDLNINYFKFPYEVEHLDGEVLLNAKQIQFDFCTQNKLTRISGDFIISSPQNPQPPNGKLNIQAEKLPLDGRLLAACPKQAAEFLREMELGGSINLQADYTYSQTTGIPESHLNLRVDLQKNSCRYKSFPYPLRNMEGTILVDDRSISATNIRGFNQNAEVTFSFHAAFPSALFPTRVRTPLPNGPQSATLEAFQAPDVVGEAANLSFQHISPEKVPIAWEFSLNGTNVQLNSGLFENLPPNLAGIFRYIQPRGPVNVHYEYQSQVEHTPLNSSPLNSVTAARPKHLALWINTTKDGIEISFPKMNYTVQPFHGSFQFQNGHFTLTNFDAEHDSTHFSGTASGMVQSVNQWNFNFDRLTIDGLAFDRDLMLALPAEARIMIASKRPGGALFYSGGLDVHYDSQQAKPFSIDWDGEIGIVDGSIDFTFPITAINGGVQLRGHWDQNVFYCGGNLNIESLFQQNIQFTKVQGPIWIDNRQIILGGKADELIHEKLRFQQNSPQNTSGISARSISMHCMAGTLYGTFALQFGYPSSFQSHVVLTDGHLENCMIFTGNDQLKGKMFGELTLAGTDSSLHSLRGKGNFHLVDADVYKLSAMMSLLKILSLKEVNNSGFSTGDAEFHIDGNHIYFDKINFSGDAFSLVGKGEMDFKSQVKLVFYSVMGRNEKNIPVVSPLLHATGRQMLLISMKGPIQNPEITQKPLPGLNMAIQQMGEELLPLSAGQNKKGN